jgi:hypothetical protein
MTVRGLPALRTALIQTGGAPSCAENTADACPTFVRRAAMDCGNPWHVPFFARVHRHRPRSNTYSQTANTCECAMPLWSCHSSVADAVFSFRNHSIYQTLRGLKALHTAA